MKVRVSIREIFSFGFFFFFGYVDVAFSCVFMVYVPGRIREGPGGRGFDGQTMSLLCNPIGGNQKKNLRPLVPTGEGRSGLFTF